ASGPASPGPFSLQAAMAAVHALSPSSAATDWAQIVRLYDRLLVLEPSPIVTLNRGVAVAERDGPAAGLAIIDSLLDALGGYHLAHSARGELCRRLGRLDEARESYMRARDLVRSGSDRRFIERRLAELQQS